MKRFAKVSRNKRVTKNENNSSNLILENKQATTKKRHNDHTVTEPQKKRTALGDLTNAIGKSLLGNNRACQSNTKQGELKLKKDTGKHDKSANITSSQGTVTSSQESTTNERYTTALEEIPQGLPELYIEEVVDEGAEQANLEEGAEQANPEDAVLADEEMPPVGEITDDELEFPPPQPQLPAANPALPPANPELPPGVTDYDAENRDDPNFAPEYAMDIFKYYMEREEKFLLKPYLDAQKDISKRMRAILVDWLVELQENMELNHETLYLSVKLVDQYLEKREVSKKWLQLLGATAMLIACKYEERYPPPVSDFLYVCDDAYSQEDMLRLESKILQAIDFEVGSPLSYRFLRRYAKADHMEMDLLTLARYVLEMSLHDYDMVFERESIKAAASLFLALRMRGMDWNPQLEYYSGYKGEQLVEVARKLNVILHNPIRDVNNVFSKYSHSVFFEVAKLPLLPVNSLSLQWENDISLEF